MIRVLRACRGGSWIMPWVIVLGVLTGGWLRAAEPAPEWRQGAVLYSLDMTQLVKRPAPLPKGVSIVSEGVDASPCLKFVSEIATSSQTVMLSLPLDLSRWQGMQVMIMARVRADAVSKPAQDYNGVKLQLYYDSPTRGKQWQGLSHTHGTFPWREVSSVINVMDDAAAGQLQLGLQGSTGTLWMSEVRVLAWRQKVVRPAPPEKAPAAFRGHELPRLRGVMSPNAFKVEDFDKLAEWNVNLIRWQLTRFWGKAGTDTDLAEYDAWINGKLDDLAKALDAAAARGIKVVIDLHSPPGGRLEDRTMRMLLEKPYQDHYVALWEKMARRFKGHPAVWGYDLINEPVQNQPSPPGLLNWYDLQVRAAKAVRAIDPVTPIIFEVDMWDSPYAFAYIQPIDVPRVIYQVHMYQPGSFTHQGVHGAWGEASGKAGVVYPGVIEGKNYDREMLRKDLADVRAFQLAYNVHIYVGEFSAIRWAPGAAKYLEDCTALFEEYGWDWTYHAFREWPGWSVEHANLPYGLKDHPLAEQPTDRYLALKTWWDKNQRAPIPAKPAAK